MNFNEAESRYKELRALLGRRKISDAQFHNEVAKLRIQTPDGIWWQIDPGDGSWRKWDGSAWVLAAKPSASVPPAFAPPPGASPQPAGQVKPKKKTASLGWRIFSFLFMRGFIMVLTFFSAWVVHTYLLVWKNDGFNAGTDIGQWLNITGSTESARSIWFYVSGLFWSFIIGCFRAGPVKTVGLLVSAPFRLFTNITKSGMMGVGGLAAGTGLSMAVLSGFGINNEAWLTMSVSWFFVAMGSAGLIAAKSIAKMFRKSPFYSIAGIFALQLFIASIAFGFLLSTVMSGTAIKIIGGLLLTAGIVVWGVGLQYKVKSAQLAMFLLFGTVSAGVILLIEAFFPRPAFADDGGWTEYMANNPDGTFEDWLQDSASQTAIQHGLAPATASALGALAPGMGSDVDLDDVKSGDVKDQLSEQDWQKIRESMADFSRIYGSGDFPEIPLVRAGFGPPSWQEIYDKLRGVNEYIQKIEIPDEWPPIHEWWEANQTARSVLIAIIAGGTAFGAGLTAPWIAAIALAAGLADKYGPDATQILDMFVSGVPKDSEPAPTPPPPKQDDYNIHTDFQRLINMPRQERIDIWSSSRSYWRQATEGTPTTPEEWAALKQRTWNRMVYELEPKIRNGTETWAEEREYRNLYNEWHVLRTLAD